MRWFKFKIKSVKMELVWFVFFIMLASFMLTGLLIFISHQVEIYWVSKIYRSPFPILLIMFFAVSVIIGTGLSFAFSRYFLLPIQKLIQATKEITKGNYNVRVQYRDREKELGRLMHSFNDMAQELASVEMFKTDFINYFSHEFKTPIISIRGFAKQLQQVELSAQQRQEYAEIIYKESERLVKLSTNVLVLTKLENQTMVTNKKQFSLDEELRHCILLLQEEWEEKNLDLEVDLEEIQYYGNEKMLSQVWINLIGNAINYSHLGGKLSIKCFKRGNRVKVRVEDRGIGMTDETLSHIFEKFYQGDLSHKTTGNGLGLSIAKRIVDLCAGTITVKSQLGKGSTFIVYLPVEDSDT